jgi:predicted MFS family arabinose efflux permease
MLCLGFFYLGIAAAISDMSISASASGDETTDTDTLVSSAMGVNMALPGVVFLSSMIGGGLLSERGGLTVLFGASTAVALLTATVLIFCTPETLAKSKRTTSVKAGTSSERWKRLFQSPLASAGLLYRHGPEVRILVILLMLMSIPATFCRYTPRPNGGLSTKDFSSYLALFGLAGMFASGLGSFLVKKMGIRKFTILAILSRSLPAIGSAFYWIQRQQSIGIVAALFSAGDKS